MELVPLAIFAVGAFYVVSGLKRAKEIPGQEVGGKPFANENALLKQRHVANRRRVNKTDSNREVAARNNKMKPIYHRHGKGRVQLMDNK